MKLRTDLIANVMFGNTVSPAGTDDAVGHDALAAHALLRAIGEQIGSDERGPLLDRADELMREWAEQDEV
ncbi:MAG: hypothetical protein KGI54_16750 [Pseudomonadota bacterium]|nr:hypothetical protein [Pseudomonadota bacterium]